MKATTVAAVGAAFVIAGLPREAAAAKLVFDVTITHVLGLPVPGFTPISFQQTVIGTFNTQAEYDSTSGPLTARINRAFSRASSSATRPSRTI